MNASSTSLAHQSRPGSLEARIVYSCTCRAAAADEDRNLRRWVPDHALDWVDVLSFDCPAHGELFVQAEKQAQEEAVERMRQRLLAGQDHSAFVPDNDNDDPQVAFYERDLRRIEARQAARKRTVPQRLWDACVGALNGWRGWT